MKYRQQSAFTIVELLIVIVVIGILAAIVIVAYNGVQERARASSASSALSQAAKKIAVWQVDNPSSSPADLATVGITNSSDVSYQYTAGTNGAYCITATNGPTSYKITETTKPTAGGCAGHGVGGVAAITNLALNPSVESDTSNWNAFSNAGSSTLSNPSSGAVAGSKYYRQTVTSGTNGAGGAYMYTLSASAGTTYTTTASVRINNSKSFRIGYEWRNSSGTGIGTVYGSPSAVNSSWTQLAHTATAPANTAQLVITFYVSSPTLNSGDVIDYDAVMIVAGSTQYAYADGNSANWVWNGTTNNSTSTGPPL